LRGGTDENLHRRTYYELLYHLGAVGKNAIFAPQNDAVKASRHSLSVCGNAAVSGAISCHLDHRSPHPNLFGMGASAFVGISEIAQP